MEKYMDFKQPTNHTHIGRTELLIDDLAKKLDIQSNQTIVEIPRKEMQETIEQLKKFKQLMNVSFIYLDSFEENNFVRLIRVLKEIEELYRTENKTDM